jgi:hypothetical protein
VRWRDRTGVFYRDLGDNELGVERAIGNGQRGPNQ